MVEQIIASPSPVVATGVSFEDYLENYAADFYEWVKGTVIKMSPIHDRHDVISMYLAVLLEAYFEINPIGFVRRDPFVMKLPDIDVAREPDIQVILKSNPNEYTSTYMNGPADICIEIVSPTSIERDYEAKLTEYESGGVGEYWIFDPMRKDALFYRRDENGRYQMHKADSDGNYRTPLLPQFVLRVPTVWLDPLPGPAAVVRAVQAMLKP